MDLALDHLYSACFLSKRWPSPIPVPAPFDHRNRLSTLPSAVRARQTHVRTAALVVVAMLAMPQQRADNLTSQTIDGHL